MEIDKNRQPQMEFDRKLVEIDGIRFKQIYVDRNRQKQIEINGNRQKK